MGKIYGKYRRNILYKTLKTALFIGMSFLIMAGGMFGGRLLSDTHISIINRIDVESFKSTLNKSLPIIDTIYNSGNVDFSFANELKGAIKAVFTVDLGNPLTIINAQSPFIASYYNNEYRALLNRKEGKTANRVPEHGIYDNAGHNEGKEGVNPPFKEDASSIVYEDERRSPDLQTIYTGKIAVQNETKFKVDDAVIDKLIQEPLKLNFDKKGPQVLIYHTHTSEAYLRNEKELGKSGIPNRSSDNRYNVVRIGEELAKALDKKGLGVVHNGTVNDYDYNSSYTTGYRTVTSILKGNPSIKVVLDIHRDGLSSDQPKLRVVSQINNKNTSKIMFVVGTSSRLKHPNWRENFKLALKLQKKLDSKYPGLTRPLNLSMNRYNQHVTDGALIIEVGADGNTVEESLESVKYLAEAIDEVLKENK
ncbi:stage II sporulation protein P [Anaerobacterium chartisolvens]|uniref:Stage II sporulation protein P n=1 Tax=Anaerobacterium chartisolvens TaxID=1297424 RepID=A0A369B8W4_9FIRM|nr:stage II sporulation protein P [Anaerobacterium chartisolvens]RCX17972.1 stage II sporulation protein P [Anaerobacterium chartisolvens]